MVVTQHTAVIQDVTFKFTNCVRNKYNQPDVVYIIFDEDNYVEIDKEALRSLLEVM